jgi:NADH-quinone oxidoreductase subunit A
MPPVGTARERFPIKFYLVCMIFILLDVDAAFLYPWALVFKDLVPELGLLPFLEMLVFMGLLGGGFVYAWKSGALDW